MNCKPGDLAFIARSDGAPENLGRIVEVVSLEPAWTSKKGVVCWLVKAKSPLVGFDIRTGRKSTHTEISAPDAWLRPISGVPVHDEQHDEVIA
ncbi:hypothetical protein [Cupriavidus basilensis]|uniref:hypothetical protein n=1 Tax=Cupriavidus basilensis TaxID=68895 RepID=UPI0039F6A8A9